KGSGEIHFQGNRYWSRELNQFAGKQVTIRFDPDNLNSSIKVYDLSNSLICDAECIEDAGFNEVDQARIHARRRADFQKAVASQKKAHAALSAQELADIIYAGHSATPEQPAIRPKVTRLVTGNLAL
ncbi:Mu transposase C-terminal domain-containing protein, partial [Enterobacter hormaechei]|nr:Mu transposase C-terminal domain-containing protein [Enterobacter hormaechei]